MEDQKVAMDERDEVQFRIYRQIYRQEGRALDIKLLEKAPDQREFGKVRRTNALTLSRRHVTLLPLADFYKERIVWFYQVL